MLLLSLLVGVAAANCPCHQTNAIVLKYKAFKASDSCGGDDYSFWTSTLTETGSRTKSENTTLETALNCRQLADKLKDQNYKCTCASIYASWGHRIDKIEFFDSSILDFQAAGVQLQNGCTNLVKARSTDTTTSAIRSVHFTCEVADLSEPHPTKTGRELSCCVLIFSAQCQPCHLPNWCRLQGRTIWQHIRICFERVSFAHSLHRRIGKKITHLRDCCRIYPISCRL